MKKNIFYLWLFLCITFFSQTQLLSQQKAALTQFQGIIQDEYGINIPNAILYYDNGNKITYTDEEGSFNFSATSANIVIIEAPGFEPRQITSDQLRFNSEIILTKKPHGLESENLVNVPFGKLYKRQLTGAVTVLNIQEIMRYDKSENVASVVNGRVPGLFGNVSVRGNTNLYDGILNIRGNTVVVIDGVPRAGYNLNLSEVESITVLKDITTRALYGAQAMDGVIMVTTRRGEPYKRRLNISAEHGISVPVSYPEFMNAADYMTFYNQALENDGLAERYSSEEINLTRAGTNRLRYPDEDYYNSTYLKDFGNYTDVIAEASGGNSGAQYYLNMGWRNSAGLLKELWKESFNDATNTFNVRGNVNYIINDFMKMKVDGVVYYESASTPNFSGNNQSFYTRASTFLPNYYPVLVDASLLPEEQLSAAKLIDGKYVPGGTSEYQTNIYAEMAMNGYLTNINRILQNNTSLDIDLRGITEGLTARTYLTFDMNNYYSKSLARSYAVYQPVFTPVNGNDSISFLKYGVDVPANNPQISGESFYRRVSLAGQLNYNREFNEIHWVDITGISYTDYHSLSGRLQDEKAVTFGFRSNYMLKKKYIAEMNMVTTGSAKLEQHKWGTSPSLGLAWILSEEGFLKDNSFVNYLKLRANAGLLKTDIYSGFRQYMNYYASAAAFNYGFGQWSNNPRVINAGNPDITWAEKRELSAGFESVLADNLHFEASYFHNTLSGIPLELSNIYPGFVEQAWENYGEFSDKGVEWGISYQVSLGKALLSFGHNAVYSNPVRVKDNVLDYAELWRKQTGIATDAIFGLQADGFYSPDDFNPDGTLVAGLPVPVYGIVKPGDIRYIDYNEDGLINDLDQIQIGNSSARFQYGLHLNLKAGDFEFFVLGTGQTGSSRIYRSAYDWVFGDRKYPETVRNSWTEENASSATYPRLSTVNNPNNFQNSTFWLTNNNFFTLHRAQLTYNLPLTAAGKAGMKYMQLYLRGTNLFTISENKKRRELNISGSPQMRNYSLGIVVNF